MNKAKNKWIFIFAGVVLVIAICVGVYTASQPKKPSNNQGCSITHC